MQSPSQRRNTPSVRAPSSVRAGTPSSERQRGKGAVMQKASLAAAAKEASLTDGLLKI